MRSAVVCPLPFKLLFPRQTKIPTHAPVSTKLVFMPRQSQSTAPAIWPGKRTLWSATTSYNSWKHLVLLSGLNASIVCNVALQAAEWDGNGMDGSRVSERCCIAARVEKTRNNQETIRSPARPPRPLRQPRCAFSLAALRGGSSASPPFRRRGKSLAQVGA